MDTYKATNTLNGKFYIGSTVNFERRKKDHLRSKENYPFQNALRKNPEAFEWEVWTDDSDDPLLEQALLDMWFGTEQCYNLNPFASRPPVMRGEDNPMFGVPKSEETKRKLRDSKTGKKASDSTRELMSIQRTGEGNNMYGKEGEESPTFGNQWWVNKDLNIETFMKESPGEGWELGRKGVSEETSQKISESTRGERNPMFGRTGENSPAWGKVWWVNKETNDEKLDKKCPGPGWVEGRKEKTESARKKHSEANIGKKWWVNSDGDTKFDLESPGEEWQEGRKWK